MQLTVVLKGDGSGLTGTIKVAESELRQLGATMDATGARAQRSAAQVDSVGAAAERAGFGVRNLVRSITSLQGLLTTLGLSYVAGEMLGAGMAANRLNTSLQATFSTQQAAAREMGFLANEADRLGIFLPTLAEGYSGLASATRGTNLEGAKTREILLGIAEAGRTMNLSNERIAGTMQAVQQIAGKGVVSLEELRQQLGDRLPGAMQIAARSMDMTVGELIEMVSAGKLSSDVFLPRFAAELRNSAAASVAFAASRPSAEFERLRTELFQLGASTSEPVLEQLAQSARSLTAALRDFTQSGSAQAMGEALAAIVRNADALAAGLVALGVAAGGRQLVGFVNTLRDVAKAADAARAAAIAQATAEQAAAAARAKDTQATLAAVAAERQLATATMATANAENAAAARHLAAAQAIGPLSGALRGVRIANEEIAAATAKRSVAMTSLATLAQQQGRLEAQLATAATAQIAAQRGLAAALGMTTGAMAALQTAGARLFALIGGWPTVILAAVAALYMLAEAHAKAEAAERQHLVTADERIAQIKQQIQQYQDQQAGLDEVAAAQ
ncbi:MAG TPA: tape measure protein, partial [Reyranellaceae bacterium]|nr:tape measure protein [Reyranellaceae bacterium]